jgi:hypothetical protein
MMEVVSVTTSIITPLFPDVGAVLHFDSLRGYSPEINSHASSLPASWI